MKINPKISIIMPVYKVEEFVGKTIESVLAQTLSEFEFFAIDDGSPDNSGKICDEYAQKDSRIIVIHKENGGAPEARNVAIERATGKYMYFIDSDDWIEPDYLEKMYQLAEEHEADLVVTGFLMEYYQKGKYVTYQTPCLDCVYSNQKTFRLNAYQYFDNSLLSLPWNKLYRSDIIMNQNIRFPKTKWDDHHFNMDYLMDVQKVVFSSMQKYHWYRSRKGSETMINYSDPNMFEKRKEHYDHILKLYEHWQLHDEKTEDAISCYYIGRVFQCIQEMVDNSKISKNAKKEKIKVILHDNITIDALKKAKSLSLKFKILTFPMKLKNVWLSYFFGWFVSFVRRHFPSLFIKLKEKEVHSS
jgi:glycosyltransferase EpsJ